MSTAVALVGAFAFLYPAVMAFVWMSGAVLYRLLVERREGTPDDLPALARHPRVSVLVPCFDEEVHIRATLRALDTLAYADFEIIAVNDGSSDATASILDELLGELRHLRVLHLERNGGKAMALNAGASAATGEIVVVVDADTRLHPHALHWLVRHFLVKGDVGAVTGNPRVLNRGSLLAELQSGEFSAIIGLIKRAERVYGRIFTVSGCVCAFHRAALNRVDYWNTDMVTEDVDISWRLQLSGYSIRFEANAACYVAMPETFAGLWRQRLRWAQGGAEVLLRYSPELRRRRRASWLMLPIYVQYVLGIVWAACAPFALAALVVDLAAAGAEGQLLAWTPPVSLVTLAGVFLLQAAVAMALDRKVAAGRAPGWFALVWYPLGYWVISAVTAVVGLVAALRRRPGEPATWKSPDRGWIAP